MYHAKYELVEFSSKFCHCKLSTYSLQTVTKNYFNFKMSPCALDNGDRQL